MSEGGEDLAQEGEGMASIFVSFPFSQAGQPDMLNRGIELRRPIDVVPQMLPYPEESTSSVRVPLGSGSCHFGTTGVMGTRQTRIGLPDYLYLYFLCMPIPSVELCSHPFLRLPIRTRVKINLIDKLRDNLEPKIQVFCMALGTS